MLHFNYPVKPWAPNAMLRWGWANPTYAPARYFALWGAARDGVAAGVPAVTRPALGAKRTPMTRVSGAGR